MKQISTRTALWLAVLVLLLGAIAAGSLWLAKTGQPTPTTVQAAPLAAKTPTPKPTAAVPGNLLINPGFEQPYWSQQDGIIVAHGWHAWYYDLPPCLPWKSGCYIPCPSNCIEGGKCVVDYGCMWARPEFGAIGYQEVDYRVHTGETAQKYFTWNRMHEGGLYQQVSGVTPGTLLEFSAWIQTWMCYDYYACDYGRKSDHPSDMHLRIGIDPTGGTVPTSTNIIWSPEAHAFDQWTYFSVQARALSSTITVFTHSRPEWEWARANNDIYLDDANLAAIGPLPVEFSSIQPVQPELGQVTTVQASSNYPYLSATLLITSPQSLPIVPSGGTMAGERPYVWTWQFTPTVPGTHTLAFTSPQLPTPTVSTLLAVAVARLAAQPSTPWLNQPVLIWTTAYYPYPAQQLTITTPYGNLIAPSDEGMADISPYTHTWRFSSAMTGTHLVTFNADLLTSPITTSVNVTSMAGVHSLPPAPPVGEPVSLQAFAYYPYTNTALSLTDPAGQVLAPTDLGRSGSSPFFWTWIFTPTITGTHICTFTADRLDVPARGLIFVGGEAVYLPVVFNRARWHLAYDAMTNVTFCGRIPSKRTPSTGRTTCP